MLILFVATLAESNRSPFDFSEGESELVSGFNTEYRSTTFVVIFLAEYLSILFLSAVVRMLFNMRNGIDLIFFIVFWSLLFIWRRGTLPRLRYDQLIYLAWKGFLPVVLISISWSILISSFSHMGILFSMARKSVQLHVYLTHTRKNEPKSFFLLHNEPRIWILLKRYIVEII